MLICRGGGWGCFWYHYIKHAQKRFQQYIRKYSTKLQEISRGGVTSGEKSFATIHVVETVTMATVAKAIMKNTRILLICHKINENRGFMCTVVIKQKGHVRFK